jgi:Helix-turn-helix.
VADHKVKKLPTRAEQAELAHAVGLRLKEAREMACLSQQQAAKLLGYSNSTKLSKIESGRHSSQIPLWVLKRAAELYDVSLDYLTGITETMERDEDRDSMRREIMIHMRESWENMRSRDAKVIGALVERIVSVEDTALLVSREAGELQEAMQRYIELNRKNWLESRGGARLEAAVERTASAARHSSAKVKRFRNENKMSGGCPQLDLVFI